MQKTVSRVWRRQVMEEHRRLNEATAELKEFLRAPRPALGEHGSHTWAAELSKRLVDLNDMLYRHFRFEEEGGMVEELVGAHPRAKRQVDGLIDDHRGMLLESREILRMALAYSDGVAPEDPALRRRLLALLDHLEEHEREENNLILDLELHDLGQGD